MRRSNRIAASALACLLGASVLGAVPVSAEAEDTEGARPNLAGPDLLRAPAVDAAQLQNTGVWEADPIGVCMTSAYSRGEYVHQGCVYDDQGGGNQYRWPLDTILRNYTYPEDDVYRRNAADILEVRAKPLADATAFRITMNTMTDPTLTGLTLALGDSPSPRPAPYGANTVLPAEQFVTVNGTDGDITDAATGESLGSPQVSVDRERRQVEIRVPHSTFDPTGQTSVRLAAAAGLWDRENDRYLVPAATPSPTRPGGAVVGDSTPSAFFDTAFRFDEPFEAPYRDNDQKRAIADGDISAFHADVDFTKLAAGTEDMSGVPTTGYMTRVFATGSEKAQGRRVPSDPGGPPAGAGTQQGGLQTGTGEGAADGFSLQFGWVCRDDCVSDLPGRMQRYMVYVPEAAPPADGYSSMVWTNGYALRPGDDVEGEDDLYQSFARRPGDPTMVIDVDARGNEQWFYGDSGAAVFEAIADARRHYDLDTERTAMGGFSSGGYGANKLSLQFPDVFSKAFICDGLDRAASFPGVNGVADTLPIDTVTQHEPGSKLTPLLPSRRNQPVMEWAGLNDDFIPYPITRERANAYALGDYDYEFISWAGLAAEHLVMCKNGMWDLATKWYGDEKRAVDPHHVTYVRNPQMDDPESGLVGDRAYWVSDIENRDDELGTIDVVSAGQGVTDPELSTRTAELGTQKGTFSPVNPYTREARDRGEPVPAPRRDELRITSQNVESITIDPERAGVTCDADLVARTDGPLRVTLTGCGDAVVVGEDGTPGDPPADLPGLPQLPTDVLGDLPLPPELGVQVPQLPLQGLPPVRFPPNTGDPRP
ncbi:hypothetical protein [Solicola sp. PLA-1-18]|uniref:hypothetical protein n=1 Tax=Solicola sp. PLA-1-18 TaxID=3380532 RepID=UPI003B8062C4